MKKLISELKLTLKVHDELNPKLWNDKKLKPDVYLALDRIGKEWATFAKIPKKSIKDVIITGGNANYNYTRFSDIDLHLVVDKTSIPCDGLIDEYLQSKKELWALTHDITVKGQPVELYAQSVEDPFRKGQGIYSLKTNTWLQEPTKYKIDRNHPEVTRKVKEWMRVIDTLIDSNSDDVTEFTKIKGRLKGMRSASIEKNGESAPENLVFKELRNRGYLEKMNQYMTDLKVKNLSLEEVDPEKFHRQLDDDSWFYQDQRRRYLDDIKKGRKIEYRIDPSRDARIAKKLKKSRGNK
jgi:hypothetical protein